MCIETAIQTVQEVRKNQMIHQLAAVDGQLKSGLQAYMYAYFTWIYNPECIHAPVCFFDCCLPS